MPQHSVGANSNNALFWLILKEKELIEQLSSLHFQAWMHQRQHLLQTIATLMLRVATCAISASVSLPTSICSITRLAKNMAL
jgi:hypothetical protein